MSGIIRLANAKANDPSFDMGGAMTASEAKALVSATDPKMPGGISMPKAPPVGKPPNQYKLGQMTGSSYGKK